MISPPSSRGRAGVRKSTNPQEMEICLYQGCLKQKLLPLSFPPPDTPFTLAQLGDSSQLSNLLSGVSHRTGPGVIVSVSLAPDPVPGASLALRSG